MINLFSHFVPGRTAVLAASEAVMLLLAAYFGISNVAGSGPLIAGHGLVMPSLAVVFAVSMIIVMSSMGLYQPDLWNRSRSIEGRLVIAFALGFAITIVASSLTPSPSSTPFALGATITLIALVGSIFLRTLFHKLNKLGVSKSRVLVLGTGSRIMKLADLAERNTNHHIVGYVSLQPSRHYIPAQLVLPVTADDSMVSLVEKYSVDQIVLGVRDRRGGGFPVKQLLECRMRGVRIVELSTFFEREYRQVLLESLNPSWMVLGDGFRQGSLSKTVKRLFDLTASLVLLFVALPVLIVAALCVYMESGLPVLYRQQRVGQHGRIFTLFKLRSMKLDAESGGAPHWAQLNDTRTTRVGRFIRKYRIDELPQIFNVLRGEMSFVGPRPERPFFVDQLVKQIPFYALRHSAKPGITGWAQVRYQYGASIDDAIEKLQYDLYYVKNHGLFLDLIVLISTLEVVFWGKGAR
jgi:sugar transferase (PEP-CTERM system associated)